MGASNETFSKREKEKARQKKKQDKQGKRDDRKANLTKGQSLDQMLAYVDENGNLSTTPPDPKGYKSVDQEEIVIGIAKREPELVEVVRRGTVTMFNSAKGFGFIRDQQNQQSVFVHQNELIDPIQENDRVTFEIKNTPKGASAVQVRKLVKTPN
ncbi:cold shock domain-containing protein [Spirosoma sp. RP8]|uniref:Cold shock domain-containing protein n=1 Tax=Spirosoma liriopis TaxID=2937440 RepID=A0ABT0HUV6_9BACT|nr:cold shock domain-containing protein [Spirosoma liriopis]MCK8495971.1 cold shock domain-containing protein [Spirosoma liriopis]